MGGLFGPPHKKFTVCGTGILPVNVEQASCLLSENGAKSHFNLTLSPAKPPSKFPQGDRYVPSQ